MDFALSSEVLTTKIFRHSAEGIIIYLVKWCRTNSAVLICNEKTIEINALHSQYIRK